MLHLLARADFHLIVWQIDSGHTSGYGILQQYKSPSTELHHFETSRIYVYPSAHRDLESVKSSFKYTSTVNRQWMAQV